MRLKKNVLIIFFAFMFILLSGIYLIKNKDIVYKDVSSNSKKYEIAYSEGKQTEYCNAYYPQYANETKIFQYNEVSEGYPLYLVNGCAYNLKNYLETIDKSENISEEKKNATKTAACDAYKTYYDFDYNAYVDEVVDTYNNSGCSDKLVKKELEKPTIDCKSLRSKITENYVEFHDYVNLYNDKCESKITPNDIIKNDYVFEQGNCESKRILNDDATSFDKIGYTGILLSNKGGNTCPYPLFYINGHAVEYDYYKENYNKNENNKGREAGEYCEELYNNVKDSNDPVKINDYRVLCNVNNIKTETIGTPVNNLKCDYKESNIIGNYDLSNFVYDETNKSGCTSTLNELSGVLGIYEYNKYPIYLVQGCAWGWADIVNDNKNECIKNNSDFKRRVCESRKKYVDRSNIDDVNEFNSVCSKYVGELELEDYIYVYFQAFNAFGMECLDVTNSTYITTTSGMNKCVYKFSKDKKGTTITLSESDLPVTTNLKQNLTSYSFSGWKVGNSSCSSGGNLTINLPADGSSLTYNACFDGVATSTLTYQLFTNCNGAYKYGVKDDTSGNINVSTVYKSDVSSEDLIVSKVKTSQGYDSLNFNHGNSFPLLRDNEYCTITCNENFSYSYPSIFATVKSGTYFDLLYYPKINSELVCTEHFGFGYVNWKTDYLNSIRAEKEALVEYLNKMTYETMQTTFIGECEDEGEYEYISYGNKIYEYNYIKNEIEYTTKTFDSFCASNKNKYELTIIAASGYGSKNVAAYESDYRNAVLKRIQLQQKNLDCANAMTPEKVSIDNFYNIKRENTKAYFIYESDVNSATCADIKKIDGNKEYCFEELELSNMQSDDTSLINYDVTQVMPEEELFEISYNGAVAPQVVENMSMSFNAIVMPDNFLRKVTLQYIFDHNKDRIPYYAENHTGNINTTGKGIKLGYVYPIKLGLSKTRDVYFDIQVNTNLNYGASQIVNKSNKEANRFKCTYDIVNDIVVEDNKKDYKPNFYTRSISTQDVDPNDRLDSGKLGTNWADEKGQAMIKLIEEKNKEKNTYNPNYLDYSFTLNVQTIEAIRTYNESEKNDNRSYGDFTKMNCEKFGGECESEFLTNLIENNKVGDIEVSDVNGVRNKSSWKYYIDGHWVLTEGLKKNSWKDAFSLNTISLNTSQCNFVSDDDKTLYDCLYREVNKGVLP